jgi:hypothetical protein
MHLQHILVVLAISNYSHVPGRLRKFLQEKQRRLVLTSDVKLRMD